MDKAVMFGTLVMALLRVSMVLFLTAGVVSVFDLQFPPGINPTTVHTSDDDDFDFDDDDFAHDDDDFDFDDDDDTPVRIPTVPAKSGYDVDPPADAEAAAERIAQTARFVVAVACIADEGSEETVCVFVGVTPYQSTEIHQLVVPDAVVCAPTIDSDEPVLILDSMTGVEGYPSGAGRNVLTLVLAGDVAVAGSTTYWVATPAGVFPARGPGLTCAGEVGPAEAAEQAAATGTIVVHKYECGAVPEPREFDWYGACAPETSETPFTLAAMGNLAGEDEQTGTTDATGVLTFAGLPDGTYHFEEADGVWCHAESDSVNDQGNLVVEAAQPVNVWIFNCGDIENPVK